VARVIWTPAALHDITRLHDFLAPKNRDAARHAVQAIRQSVKLLGAHPELGRPAKAMPAFREWLIRFGDGGYVALYRYQGDMVRYRRYGRHPRRTPWSRSGISVHPANSHIALMRGH
jgi:plasmid stabilization system protein ParE